MQLNDITSLKYWFALQRRDLPWRDNPNPYAIWVSEIMLQQTQVAVVIPYFERWMRRFPSIHALANAPLDEVIKEWEGLGYYSRARNLHAGAQYVVKEHNGQLPSSPELLSKIKGIGPYTLGAILGFAFHQRIPAVDGNVLRVLARYYAIQEDISKQKTVRLIENKAQILLPENEPWLISEALIELGATVCGRNPKCSLCPLNKGCAAHLQGMVDKLPFRAPRVPTTYLYRAVVLIVCKDTVLIGRGKAGQVMADLYQFPYFELETSEITRDQIKEKIGENWGLPVKWKKEFPLIKHSFTKYAASLFSHLFEIESPKELPGYEWHPLAHLSKMTLSAGHRRILSYFLAG